MPIESVKTAFYGAQKPSLVNNDDVAVLTNRA